MDTLRDKKILEKKLKKNILNKKDFNNWWYINHLSKRCIKNWSVTSLSTTKPKKIRKLKRLITKYVTSSYNQINKKIKSDYDYVVNLADT